MKLSHLTLRSFRSFVGMDLPLDAPRVLIAGLNGTGKTTVANAIRWGLTGHCEGTDARGAGAEILIPQGAKRAEVGIAIDGIGTLSRSYAENGGGTFAVDTFTGTSQIQQQALYIKLNTTPEFLDAVLDTGIFLDLNHVDAKALVLSLLGVKIPIGDKSYTLDELDQRYKQEFENRKVAKKILAGMTVPVAPTGQMPTTEAIEEQLGKLRQTLGSLRQAVGSIAGRRQALREELRRINDGAETVIPDDVSDTIAEVQEKLAALEAEAVPAAVDAPAPAKGDPNRLTFLRSSVELIQRHTPKNGCVLDREIPCKTMVSAFTDRLKVLVDELKGLDPKPAAAPEKVAASPLTMARAHLRALEQQQAERTAAEAARTEAMRRITAIEQELSGLSITTTQDAEIATLESRITKGEQLLKDARAHWAAMEAAKAASLARQEQALEVERLELLVEELGPKGVRVQALADALGKFEAEVNPYLVQFGWKVSFTVDPWEVFINSRPAESYSESERFRIGVSLQLGIAMLSGLKFAIVDRIDQLDVANRGIVTKMLLTAPLDQIVILGTREMSQTLPQVPGVLAYRLDKQGDRSVVAESTGAMVAA